MVTSAGKLQYLWGPNNASLTLLTGGIVSPTATLIFKDKIIEIQIEVGAIALSLNEISKIQIGMHTTMLNEIVKGKIFEIQIESGTIAMELNKITIRACTSAEMLNKIEI